MKRLLTNTLSKLNNQLSLFEKIVFSILIPSLIIVTLISFIQTYPYFALMIGFILFLTGTYLLIKKSSPSSPRKFNLQGKKNYMKNYHVNTGGGNFNESIHGHYIQGDYINIQGNTIDLNKDITQIISELRDIKDNMINTGYTLENAVVKMTNELLEQINNNPRFKRRLFDENADANEIAEEFIELLLDNNRVSSGSKTSNSVYLEEDDYQETISYKGYTIYLESDKDGTWHYKIDGLLFNNSGESYFKYRAIDEAKGKIDEERFRNW